MGQLWTWARERVWAQFCLAALGALTAGGYIMTALDIADRIAAAQSYWWKFLLWLFSTPPWISVVCFTIIAAITLLRDHPALVVAARKLRRPKPDPIVGLCAGMRRASGRFSDLMKSGDAIAIGREREFHEEAGRWVATSAGLLRLGIPVPFVDFDSDPQGAMRRSVDYCMRIEPLLACRELDLAKQKAAQLAA